MTDIKSVIENASKLNWENVGIFGGYRTYVDECRAHKPLGDFLIRKWFRPKNFEVHFINKEVKGGFKSIDEAKKYAEEMCKKELMKILEL